MFSQKKFLPKNSFSLKDKIPIKKLTFITKKHFHKLKLKNFTKKRKKKKIKKNSFTEKKKISKKKLFSPKKSR